MNKILDMLNAMRPDPETGEPAKAEKPEPKKKAAPKKKSSSYSKGNSIKFDKKIRIAESGKATLFKLGDKQYWLPVKGTTTVVNEDGTGHNKYADWCTVTLKPYKGD
jgi:hypothetical protein